MKSKFQFGNRLGITDQLYKFKWGKLINWLIDCSLGTRLCDRRLVLWLVNSGIWQSVDVEEFWNVVAFSPVFGEWMVLWSVCRSEEVSGLLLVSSWTDRRVWLDFIAESGWCVFLVNQYGFLPSVSSTSPPPSTFYNSLNNARKGSGFHMKKQEKTLYK